MFSSGSGPLLSASSSSGQEVEASGSAPCLAAQRNAPSSSARASVDVSSQVTESVAPPCPLVESRASASSSASESAHLCSQVIESVATSPAAYPEHVSASSATAFELGTGPSNHIGSRPTRRKKLRNRSLFSKEEADSYRVARRLAQQAWNELSLHIVAKVMVREDAVLRDIWEEKRKLRLPADRRDLEALEQREVGRIAKLQEDVEDAYAEVRNEPFVVVCTVPWFG